MSKKSSKHAALSKAKRLEILKTNLFVYSLLILPLIHFVVFYVFTNLRSFIMPFMEEGTGAWGFGNFKAIFGSLKDGASSDLFQSLKNTLIYFAAGFLMICATFVLAYFIYKKILGYKIFRVIFTLPMIVSGVVLVALYKNLLSAGGPLEKVWAFFGGKMPYFLYEEGLATAAIVLFTVWTGFGMNLILFSGAMARIPDSVLEYARVDGCGFFREMFQIVMPIIWPTVSIMLLLSMVGIFSADGPIILFSGGMYGTSTIGYWMYNNVVLHEYYNYAATFGLILTVVTLPILVVTRVLFKRMPQEITF
jgi:ABC-type sugar transport system permease subunit